MLLTAHAEEASMQTISVVPADGGWAVRCEAIANPLMFTSGARAERAAGRLAQALAQRGEAVAIKVHMRNGEPAGRYICPPG
jgi:hypothetical protein